MSRTRALRAHRAALSRRLPGRRRIRSPHQPVEPPVASAGAIPDAPVNGTIRGAKFVAPATRATSLDHRVGYAHADIKLSAGSAEGACGRHQAGRVHQRVAAPRALRQDRHAGSAPRAGPGEPVVGALPGARRGRRLDGQRRRPAVVVAPRRGRRRQALRRLAVCFADDAEELRLRLVRGPPLPAGDRRPGARHAASGGDPLPSTRRSSQARRPPRLPRLRPPRSRLRPRARRRHCRPGHRNRKSIAHAHAHRTYADEDVSPITRDEDDHEDEQRPRAERVARRMDATATPHHARRWLARASTRSHRRARVLVDAPTSGEGRREYPRRRERKSVAVASRTSPRFIVRSSCMRPEVTRRQRVLTFPFQWRRRLAQDGSLPGSLTRIFVESVHAFSARRGAPGGKTGAVTAVQRTSSDLRLNPHLHTVVLDDVHREHGSALAWEETRHLRTRDVRPGLPRAHGARRIS